MRCEFYLLEVVRGVADEREGVFRSLARVEVEMDALGLGSSSSYFCIILVLKGRHRSFNIGDSGAARAVPDRDSSLKD